MASTSRCKTCFGSLCEGNCSSSSSRVVICSCCSANLNLKNYHRHCGREGCDKVFKSRTRRFRRTGHPYPKKCKKCKADKKESLRGNMCKVCDINKEIYVIDGAKEEIERGSECVSMYHLYTIDARGSINTGRGRHSLIHARALDGTGANGIYNRFLNEHIFHLTQSHHHHHHRHHHRHHHTTPPPQLSGSYAALTSVAVICP